MRCTYLFVENFVRKNVRDLLAHRVGSNDDLHAQSLADEITDSTQLKVFFCILAPNYSSKSWRVLLLCTTKLKSRPGAYVVVLTMAGHRDLGQEGL